MSTSEQDLNSHNLSQIISETLYGPALMNAMIITIYRHRVKLLTRYLHMQPCIIAVVKLIE